VKINNLKSIKHNVLKYNLLYFNIYKLIFTKKNFKNSIGELDGLHKDLIILNKKKIEAHIKKTLKLIYRYDVNNLNILFLGFPKSSTSSLTAFLKKNTQLDDSIQFKNNVLYNNYYKTISDLGNKKINFIVCYQDFNFFSTHKSIKIPNINLSNNKDFSDNNKNFNTLFLLLLISILNRKKKTHYVKQTKKI